MIAFLLVLAQAAAPSPPAKGMTLRELQERARKNDPRAMQAVAQLENAQGKRSEADWALFPNFQTTGYIAGPVNERRLTDGDNAAHPPDPGALTPGTTGSSADPVNKRRLTDGDNAANPTDPGALPPGSLGSGLFHGQQGITGHIEVQAILPVWTFGKLTAGKEAAKHLVGATEALLQRARDQSAFDVARAYWGYQTARNADTAVQKVRDRLNDARQTAQKLIAQKSEQISRADAMKIDYLAE